MSSIGKRRGRVRGLRASVVLALGIWGAILLGGATAAQARPGAFEVPLPSPLPHGYSVESTSSARFVFPTAARSEVAELRKLHAGAWARLCEAFGVYLPQKLDIRIALNPEHMRALVPSSLGQRMPSYASGVAYPDRDLIVLSLTDPHVFTRPDLERVFVHELAHVALHRAVEGHPVPRWFTEGVAVVQAGEHSLERIVVLWEGTLRGKLWPLRQLTHGFPTRHGEVSLAYAQAADLAQFLLAGPGGTERFRTLISKVRAGIRFEDAIAAAYGSSLARIEQNARERLAQRYGGWPSTLVGLSALWALGAMLLVVGYARVRRRHHETLARWQVEEAAAEPPAAQPVVTPPPTPPLPPPRNVADDVLDAWGDQRRRDPTVPTIVHEGRSHTLH